MVEGSARYVLRFPRLRSVSRDQKEARWPDRVYIARGVVRISNVLAINVESVGVVFGIEGFSCDGPDTIGALVHVDRLGDSLDVELDMLSIRHFEPERHSSVRVNLWIKRLGREICA